RAARRAAEEAGSKLSFLAEASRLLASSLDYDATLRQLARLAAPTLGDWCAVDLIEDGRLRRVATAYADRAQEPAAREFARRIPLDLDAEGGAPRVIREGRPVLVPRVTDRELRQVARDPEPLRLLHRARLRSYMCVPLIARGRTLGAMTFITAQGERELTAEDLRLAEDLAARAATAVDNARLFAEAQTIAAELRVANQAKDEFLGLVSHELRTPITTIFGNAQVLRNRANRLDDESRALAVEDIEQEAERLHRIIDNMLVLSRVEAGREIETEPLVVERTLRRIIDSYAQRHPQRPIELRTEGRVAPVSAEPTYFEQIVRNLLSNADKYSPPGAPIEVTARPDGTAAVVVSVADRGKGIPPEEMGLIFRTFFRSPRTSAQASGAGIGLAVCKRLVEVQGGRIWARAREGGGTEFGFSLPLEKESKP
ncbi:MAG TPA: ATP-binding protein, partial [Dehalococcoidia bacterium]|nr:ATP-binding protein [Dehalococcoidia bacterium]